MNNDLISREALKKAIDEKHTKVFEDYEEGYNDGLNEIIDLIDNAPTITFDKVHSYDIGYSEGIKECNRLKAENNRLTAELERVYELYNGVIASKQEQPRKGCPFGDQRETCAEFRANGCDLCKFATL
jgi:hypothetical protein